MKTRIAVLALASSLVPSVVLANTVDSSLIPEGTYVVHVEKVQDAAHVVVSMNNGIETVLTATGTVSFSKVKANDTIKVTIVKGKVPVYALQ